MRNSAILIFLLLLLGGCASLTPPQQQGQEVATADSVQAPDIATSPLERYWAVRNQTDTTAAGERYVVVMPLRDKSGFREGIWPLEQAMSRYLSYRFSESPNWTVVPFEAVLEVLGPYKKIERDRALQVGSELAADIVLVGVLEDYDMRRVSVGDPLLAGYKSYTGIAKIAMEAYQTRSGQRMGRIDTDQELVDRGLGLDLLGKPRDQDLQFSQLAGMAFGSDDFLTTALGQATNAAAEELTSKLTELVHPSGLRLKGKIAEVISVYEDEVYINVGTDNGMGGGIYRFEVFPGPDRVQAEGLDGTKPVGVVQVQEVIGARLSSVRVLQGRGQIQPGDLLRAMGKAP